MKIIFTAKENDWNAQMDQRFGRAEMFLFYDEEVDSLEAKTLCHIEISLFHAPS
jgi:predicted Fe-Mo cluster-binding NifX family protein